MAVRLCSMGDLCFDFRRPKNVFQVSLNTLYIVLSVSCYFALLKCVVFNMNVNPVRDMTRFSRFSEQQLQKLVMDFCIYICDTS